MLGGTPWHSLSPPGPSGGISASAAFVPVLVPKAEESPFAAGRCPAPPSHRVCSSRQGGEAAALGRELLLLKFYFPSPSQHCHSRVRPVPPRPPHPR